MLLGYDILIHCIADYLTDPVHVVKLALCSKKLYIKLKSRFYQYQCKVNVNYVRRYTHCAQNNYIAFSKLTLVKYIQWYEHSCNINFICGRQNIDYQISSIIDECYRRGLNEASKFGQLDFIKMILQHRLECYQEYIYTGFLTAARYNRVNVLKFYMTITGGITRLNGALQATTEKQGLKALKYIISQSNSLINDAYDSAKIENNEKEMNRLLSNGALDFKNALINTLNRRTEETEYTTYLTKIAHLHA